MVFLTNFLNTNNEFAADSETPNLEVVAEDAVDPEIKAFQVSRLSTYAC